MFGRSPGRSVSCVCECVLSCARFRPHSHSVGHSALRPELRAVAACSPVNAGRQVQLDEGKRACNSPCSASIWEPPWLQTMSACRSSRATPSWNLNKQVRTSRNVGGGWWATALMGGLNYQIEHHLFPTMPRPHLNKARQRVREHCRSNDAPYTETSLITAWGIVVRHRRGCCSRGLSNSCLLPTPNGGRQ
jgi:hypothetical protein